MWKSASSDSDSMSFEIVRLEDVIIEAMQDFYDIDGATNVFNRLRIYHMMGIVQLTHRDRLALCRGFFKYHKYLVFELRTPAPKVLKADVAQVLIKCEN